VSGKIDPAFHNSRSLLQHIDLLPEGAKWYCTPFELEGDELDAENKPRKETVELWHRDPVECVRELLGNPSFTNQGYAAVRMFKNEDYTNREYSEMWTADWWWNIQVHTTPFVRIAKMYLPLDVETPAPWLNASTNHHSIRQDPANTFQWR
jgi:hypothetical protein